MADNPLEAALTAAYADMAASGGAKPASHGTESAPVLFDAPDHEEFNGIGQGAEYRVRFQSSAFPTLAAESTLVIAPHSYRVREVRAILDGSEKVAWLQRIA